MLGSDVSDAEKIKFLRDAQQSQPKPTVREMYVAAAHDPKVDPLTRSLLSWFADVEADSGAMMAETYTQVEGVS